MKKLLNVLLIIAGISSPLMAASISTTTVGAGTWGMISLQPHESLTYSISGTFTGVTAVETTTDMTNWMPIGISTTNNAVGTFTGILYSGDRTVSYRFNGSTITSGAFVYAMSDNDDFVIEQLNNKHVPITQTFDDSFRIIGEDGLITPVVTATTLTATSVAVVYVNLSEAWDITVTTPVVTGQIVVDANFDVYVSCGTGDTTGWLKVGSQ